MQNPSSQHPSQLVSIQQKAREIMPGRAALDAGGKVLCFLRTSYWLQERTGRMDEEAMWRILNLENGPDCKDHA